MSVPPLTPGETVDARLVTYDNLVYSGELPRFTFTRQSTFIQNGVFKYPTLEDEFNQNFSKQFFPDMSAEESTILARTTKVVRNRESRGEHPSKLLVFGDYGHDIDDAFSVCQLATLERMGCSEVIGVVANLFPAKLRAYDVACALEAFHIKAPVMMGLEEVTPWESEGKVSVFACSPPAYESANELRHDDVRVRSWESIDEITQGTFNIFSGSGFETLDTMLQTRPSLFTGKKVNRVDVQLGYTLDENGILVPDADCANHKFAPFCSRRVAKHWQDERIPVQAVRKEAAYAIGEYCTGSAFHSLAHTGHPYGRYLLHLFSGVNRKYWEDTKTVETRVNGITPLIYIQTRTNHPDRYTMTEAEAASFTWANLRQSSTCPIYDGLALQLSAGDDFTGPDCWDLPDESTGGIKTYDNATVIGYTEKVKGNDGKDVGIPHSGIKPKNAASVVKALHGVVCCSAIPSRHWKRLTMGCSSQMHLGTTCSWDGARLALRSRV